tara:strand:+ start:649 stop:948 length:300 start_codon:yes stop_codon:yes gene_type:complete
MEVRNFEKNNPLLHHYANDSSNANKQNDGVIDAVIDVARKTKNMLVDESKTIAPDVVDAFKDSRKRLDSDNRIIRAIPNSYLYWGIVVVVGYVVVKKYN